MDLTAFTEGIYTMLSEKWDGFKEGIWQEKINVRDFIQQNYTEYTGDILLILILRAIFRNSVTMMTGWI